MSYGYYSYNSKETRIGVHADCPVFETKKGLKCVGWDRPMIDLDIDSDDHPRDCITFSDKLQAYDHLFTLAYSYGLRLAIYETASGLHAFDISREWETFEDGQWLHDIADVDPIYREYCQKSKAYNERVSPKPGRSENPPVDAIFFGPGKATKSGLKFLNDRREAFIRYWNS